jgi:FdhD protein
VTDLASIVDVDTAIDVRLAGPRRADLPSLLAGRRQVAQNASCGLCGRRSIDSLQVAGAPIARDWTLPAALVSQLPERLRARQNVFDQTGGLHAAGLFDRRGDLLVMAEDVGRHNAVDKVVGRMFLHGRLPLDESVLFVSGRTSFELVQKAMIAGIPMLAAVSAPSTLAIDLAAEAGITLVGFVRGDSFNVYTHGFRIAS